MFVSWNPDCLNPSEVSIIYCLSQQHHQFSYKICLNWFYFYFFTLRLLQSTDSIIVQLLRGSDSPAWVRDSWCVPFIHETEKPLKAKGFIAKPFAFAEPTEVLALLYLGWYCRANCFSGNIVEFAHCWFCPEKMARLTTIIRTRRLQPLWCTLSMKEQK